MIYADTKKEREALQALGFKVKDHPRASMGMQKAIAKDTLYQVASQLTRILKLRSTRELGIPVRHGLRG